MASHQQARGERMTSEIRFGTDGSLAWENPPKVGLQHRKTAGPSKSADWRNGHKTEAPGGNRTILIGEFKDVEKPFH